MRHVTFFLCVLFQLFLATMCEAQEKPLQEMVLDLGDNVTMKLVQIPAGKFRNRSRTNRY